MHKSTSKHHFFVPSPTSIIVKNTRSYIELMSVTQEERELLKAGYDVYYISVHNNTITLVVDVSINKIIDMPEDFTLQGVPHNLEALMQMIEDSKYANATVTQLCLR